MLSTSVLTAAGEGERGLLDRLKQGIVPPLGYKLFLITTAATLLLASLIPQEERILSDSIVRYAP